MLKYASKFAMDILPSVVATIIGAYIVNHYIVTKPGTAPAAAVVSTVEPKADTAKAEVKAAEPSADVASIPEPGVRAKGISEKSISEKAVLDRSVGDRPRPAAPREKAVAKVVPAPAQQPSAGPTVVPVVAVPNPAPPVEAAIVTEEHRDANDLARAAIERLRAGDGSPRPQETARAPDPARVVDAPRPDAPRVVSAPPVRPLPPPIMVSTPPVEVFDSATGSALVKQPYASVGIGDPRRPTPPADIPAAGPLDLRADAADSSPRQHTTVAEDMLLAAKSMFHAVLPNNPANNPPR
jgi:hypothetical protein